MIKFLELVSDEFGVSEPAEFAELSAEDIAAISAVVPKAKQRKFRECVEEIQKGGVGAEGSAAEGQGQAVGRGPGAGPDRRSAGG